MKKILTYLLSVVVILSLVPTVSAIAAEKTPITDGQNSIIVYSTVEEERDFGAEDFPEVDCNDVYVIDKDKIVGGYTYTLVLTVNDDMDATLDAVTENALVTRAEEDDLTGFPASTAELDKSDITLLVGQTATIDIASMDLYGHDIVFGVTFVVDHDIISMDDIEYGCFADCGIEDFWGVPDESLDEDFWLSLAFTSGSNYVDNQPTESGVYCGYFVDGGSFSNVPVKEVVEYIDALSNKNGIIEAHLYTEDSVPPGSPGANEIWTVNDDSVLSITTYGGIRLYVDSYIDQTAEIFGIAPGTATVTYVYSGSAYATAQCTVSVVSPADVNGDNSLNSLDAAQILKYDADIINGETWQGCDGYTTGDFNNDGEVNSLDAAGILKFDANLLPELPEMPIKENCTFEIYGKSYVYENAKILNNRGDCVLPLIAILENFPDIVDTYWEGETFVIDYGESVYRVDTTLKDFGLPRVEGSNYFIRELVDGEILLDGYTAEKLLIYGYIKDVDYENATISFYHY